MKAPLRDSQTRIITTLVSLALFLCHQSPITAFMLKDHSGRRDHQRSERSYTHGSSSRRRSILNDGNTREDMEDNVLLLPLFEAELIKLQRDEDSKEAQRIRIQDLKTIIDDAKTAAEFGVRKVQSEFYDAFSTADYDKMSGVWSRSDGVCCAHPGMHSLQGITAVMESWRQIFAGYDGSDDKHSFQIKPSRVKVDICGRTAICTCVEETNGGRLEALNIYRREEGSWKLINHVASPVMM